LSAAFLFGFLEAG